MQTERCQKSLSCFESLGAARSTYLRMTNASKGEVDAKSECDLAEFWV